MNRDLTSVLAVSTDGELLATVTRFLSAVGYPTVALRDPSQVSLWAAIHQPAVALIDTRSGTGVTTSRLREIWQQAADLDLTLLAWIGPASDGEEVELSSLVEAGADDLIEVGAWGELLARLRTVARLREFESRLSQQCQLDHVSRLATEERFEQSLESAWNNGAPLGVVHVRFDAAASRDPGLLGKDLWQAVFVAAAKIVQQLAPRALCATGDLRDGSLKLLCALDEGGAESAERMLKQLAEQLRSDFEKTRLPGPFAGVPLSVSCGVAVREQAESPAELLANARDAALCAQRQGGNLVVTEEQWRANEELLRAAMAPDALYLTTSAGHLMKPFSWTLRQDESLRRAENLFQQTCADSVPVLGEGHEYLGLLLRDGVEGDLSRHVSEVCEQIPTVKLNTSFDEVFALLMQPNERLVVLDGERPVGLIRADEIALLDQPPQFRSLDSSLGTDSLMVPAGSLVVAQAASL
ncbi:MAG: hypothetical protein KDB14_00430 [Planctomycetales bacterium]|nr:hypothetical protein [Planctomycetales bacterium]